MKMIDLFSGIAGFSLAGSWLGWKTIAFCEIDKFCQSILKQHFPNIPIHGDIKTTDFTIYRGQCDIITGGPPCQPASNAGKRKGENDDRWLWPEAIRVLGEVMPPIAIFENPDDLLSLDNGKAFERICRQMENLGYKVETIGIPACFVGAWHKRDRIWIITYLMHDADKGNLANRKNTGKTSGSQEKNIKQWETLDWERIWAEFNPNIATSPNINSKGLSKPTQRKFGGVLKQDEPFKGSSIDRGIAEIGLYWETEPGVGRMVHGIPNRVDRIKALGNSIVPQIAYQIFKAIDQYELLINY